MNDHYDVFISYRREGGQNHARTIQQALEKKYRVFLDFDELNDGVFDQRIMDAISHSSVFLLLLTKGALDRCSNEDDWVRKEILYASECSCHIVPVTIDDPFDGYPSDLPKEIQDIVGAHQFSELQTRKLFKPSMELLIRDRIKPHVRHEDDQSGTEIHIETDADCDLYRFTTFVKRLQAGADNVVYLKPGKHKLVFISTEFSEVREDREYSLPTDINCDYLIVNLKEKVKVWRKEEEAKQKDNKYANNLLTRINIYHNRDNKSSKKKKKQMESNVFGGICVFIGLLLLFFGFKYSWLGAGLLFLIVVPFIAFFLTIIVYIFWELLKKM